MPSPIIVGLCGPAGAGKSSIAQLTAARGDPQAPVLPLAGPLRDGLRTMGITKADNPDLYRTCAQRLGTDLVRAHSPSHWVDLWRREFDTLRRMWRDGGGAYMPRFVIIDDIRFDNEEALCDLLFVVVRPNLRSRLSTEQASHASEAFWQTALPRCPTLLNEEGRADEASDRLLQAIKKYWESRVDSPQTVS